MAWRQCTQLYSFSTNVEGVEYVDDASANVENFHHNAVRSGGKLLTVLGTYYCNSSVLRLKNTMGKYITRCFALDQHPLAPVGSASRWGQWPGGWKMALDLKTLYDMSPIFIQNLMVSVQGWQFAYRRWDPALVRALLADLLESQWWSAERFEAFQNQKLHEHIKFAAERIPYYQRVFREAGINPDDIRTREDLTRIPILEKTVVRDSPEQFLVDGRPDKRWRQGHTSGTTGTPLDVYTTRESFSRHWSFICRLRAWAGLPDPIFPRRIQFSGRDVVPIRQPARPQGLLATQRTGPGAHLFDSPPDVGGMRPTM